MILKKDFIFLALVISIATGSLFIGTSSVKAEDVWAATTANGDKAYVVSESVYNEGDGFGCKVKLYTNRTAKWHVEDFFFDQQDDGTWLLYRDGKLEKTWGFERLVFDVASRYR